MFNKDTIHIFNLSEKNVGLINLKYLMNIVDIVIVVFLLFGLIKGIFKGLFVEVASVIGLIAGVYGAIHFSYFAKDFLLGFVNWQPEYISITSFAITFISIIIVISLLGKLLTKIANFAALGMLNKLLGGVFGMLKIAIILSVVIFFFSKINKKLPFLEKEILEESVFYSPIQKLVPTLFPIIENKNPKENNEKQSIDKFFL